MSDLQCCWAQRSWPKNRNKNLSGTESRGGTARAVFSGTKTGNGTTLSAETLSRNTQETHAPGTIRTEMGTVRVAMPADSRRGKIFDFVREFAVKYFRIVPVKDSTQQNKT